MGGGTGTKEKFKEKDLDDKVQHEDWKKNVEYFEQHKKEIRKKYGEKQYVAINYQKGVLGDDSDRWELYRRMEKKHPNKNYIIKNIKSSETVNKINSPFFDRDEAD
jgi:hypothetical protein